MAGYGADVHLSPGGEGQNTDIDSGAAEPLAASTPALAVELKALPGNTGVVYYKTNGTAAANNAYPLSAGQSSGWIPVPGNDLANISVIASVDNQGMAYRYLR